mmetsp:Transcript_50456/g.130010  ORF Transcript_50456/g.130010 Transcript_50456/m.130010 type:complete len:264 (+) Transcript_50456:115-906(+)
MSASTQPAGVEQVKLELDTSNFLPDASTKSSPLDDKMNSLDVKDVMGWGTEECCDFLEWLGFKGEHHAYKEALRQNNIEGVQLLQMTDAHLKEMGIAKVGHRVVLEEVIKQLRSKKQSFEGSKTLWEGYSPASCCWADTCIGTFCYCIYAKTKWKVTPQGVRKRPELGCCWACLTCRCVYLRRSEFLDYRFVKDVDREKQNTCCCCRQRAALNIVAGSQYMHNPDAVESGFAVNNDTMRLVHPDVKRVEELIRVHWQTKKLVD